MHFLTLGSAEHRILIAPILAVKRPVADITPGNASPVPTFELAAGTGIGFSASIWKQKKEERGISARAYHLSP